MQGLAQRYQSILSEIAAACARVGRDPAEVTVVAVSKTVGISEVAAAIDAGIHDFGENRTSMFDEKCSVFPQERWHFIGSIQTNKIKEFVGRATLVHSVASERALLAIAKRAASLGIVQRLLVEVNVSGEESKDGITSAALPGLLRLASETNGIEVRGLMTLAPQGDAEAARTVFRELRELRDRMIVAVSSGRGDTVSLDELSMGMSEDYPQAVEEGATIVRVGRSIWS